MDEETEKKVKRILQKGPSKKRVEFSDGSEGWIANDDVITYM